MITVERKSKYKLRVTIPDSAVNEIEWCKKSFGDGGRKKKWRTGWAGSNTTFYFKEPKDASYFLLRWS